MDESLRRTKGLSQRNEDEEEEELRSSQSELCGARAYFLRTKARGPEARSGTFGSRRTPTGAGATSIGRATSSFMELRQLQERLRGMRRVEGVSNNTRSGSGGSASRKLLASPDQAW